MMRMGHETSTHFFFVPGWAWGGSHLKRVGRPSSELVFLHLMRSMGHVTNFGVSGMKCQYTIYHARVGLVRIP
jgi:hypothetical protein